MPPGTFYSLPRQLEEARAELLGLEALRQKHGCVVVDDSVLASRTQAVHQAARVYEGWREKVRSDREELSRRQASCQSLRESIKDWKRRRRRSDAAIWVTIIFGAFTSVLVGLCVGVAVKPALGVLFAFIALCLTTLPVLWLAHRKEGAEGQLDYLNEKLDLATEEAVRLEGGLPEARDNAKAAYQQWEAAYQEYKRVKFLLHDLGPSVRKAREQCDTLERAEEARKEEIQQLRQSRWWQLLNSNWRGLRDVAFENFLQEVFELLGYVVQTTKASGDQGIDLILTGKGRRIGVQCKGYAGSVGNDAVQEAFTGAHFYRCDCSVAITNSKFTSHARALASRVGCVLIDGAQLPALIQGQIELGAAPGEITHPLMAAM